MKTCFRYILIESVVVLLAVACSKNDEIIRKPYDGKVIVCFGASNTERGYWVEKMSKITGGTYYNLGIGGTLLGQRKLSSNYAGVWDKLNFYLLSSYIKSGDYSVLDNAVQIIFQHTDGADDYREKAKLLEDIDYSKVDYILLSYGGNDFTEETPIGDLSSNDGTTVIGAMNMSIDNIHSKYPNIKFLVHTTTYRWLSDDGLLDTDNTKNSLGLYTADYVDAILRCAHNRNIPGINMMEKCNFSKNNHNVFFVDRSHFNESGGAYYASVLGAWMLSLVQ